jgi:orotate phosphoribosyltransferase
MDTDRFILLDSIKRRVYRYTPEKPIILKSGRESPHYVDIRSLLLDPTHLKRTARLFAGLVQHRFTRVDFVAGVALGACAPALALATELDVPCLFIRSEQKDHGLKKLVEYPPGFEHVSTDHGLLVEDVITTGGSVERALKTLDVELKVRVQAILAVVDRREPASSRQESISGKDVFALYPLEEIAAHSLVPRMEVRPC